MISVIRKKIELNFIQNLILIELFTIELPNILESTREGESLKKKINHCICFDIR